MPNEKFQPGAPHSLPIDALESDLDTSSQAGLSEREAETRIRSVGSNRLRKHQSASSLRILLRQFSSVIICVLVVAFLVALVMHRWPETIAIAAVILVNTLIGFTSEWRATRTINALRRKEEAHAVVVRGGESNRIPVRELVPGDLIELNEGDLVPADARVVASEGLRINEAALTGESEPVTKDEDPVDENKSLAERSGMVYKGCAIVGGRGKALVTGTGMQTEIGAIARSAMEAESTEVPLRERLDRLGRRFVWLVVAAVFFVIAVGWWRGRDPVEIIETAVALGIAAVPEGLPIVATIALAHGMWRMGKHNAIVKQLQAVQALGSVPYLFVDKTGTLTENSMELVKLVSPEDEWELEGEEPPDDIAKRILEIGVLCNGASIDDEDEPKKGDPLEIALLEAGRKHGIEKESLEEAGEKLRTVEFDRETMMMAVFYRRDDADEIAVAVKGAPERVLSACSSYRTKNGSDDFDDETREKWIKRAEELAGEGYRILAAASKTVDSEESEPYDALDFHGFFVMEDPLRENVAESIDECEAAGIKIIMVTGDKPETAEAIARDSGIGKEGDDLHLLTGKELDALELENEGDAKKVLGADMAARVEPQQKMDLIEAAQADGEAVGMTGDGVNDAPALKRANIGIAMGERGTEAAKEVADIVLRDDALGTIVEAVRRGRTIMDNIRKAAMFFLCTNLAEIIALVVGAALDYPLPLLALQILYLNVITDVFPALALGLGPADQNVMNERSERNSRAILAPEHWAAVVGLGLLLAACTLGALVLAKELLGLSDLQATTVSFLTLGLSKVWFPFNLRDYESPFFLNEVTRNSWVWGAVLLCLILLGSAVYFRPLGTILETELIPASAWGMILAFSLVPFVISQIVLVGLKLQKRA